jgi:hypothetical protein
MIVPGLAAPPVVPAAGCPSCGGSLAPGAVLCTNCGYNLKTGRRAQVEQVAARPVPVRKPRPAAGGSSNLAVVIVGVILAGLFGLAWVHPLGAVAFALSAALFFIVISLVVLVAAFQDSVGQGFLTLCVPFYVLYFVYGRLDSRTIKGLYSLALAGYVGLIALKSALEAYAAAQH